MKTLRWGLGLGFVVLFAQSGRAQSWADKLEGPALQKYIQAKPSKTPVSASCRRERYDLAKELIELSKTLDKVKSAAKPLSTECLFASLDELKQTVKTEEQLIEEERLRVQDAHDSVTPTAQEQTSHN